MNALKITPFVQNGIGRKEFAILVGIGICIMALFLWLDNYQYLEDFSIVTYFTSSLPLAFGLWLVLGNALGIVWCILYCVLYAEQQDSFMYMSINPMLQVSFVSYLLLCMCRCRNMGVSVWRCLVPIYNPILLLAKKTKDGYSREKRDLFTLALSMIIFISGSAYMIYDYRYEILPSGHNECPKCKSSNIGRYVYVHEYFPEIQDPTTIEKVKSGALIPNGFMDSDSPKYRCNDCKHDWGHY